MSSLNENHFTIRARSKGHVGFDSVVALVGLLVRYDVHIANPY